MHLLSLVSRTAFAVAIHSFIMITHLSSFVKRFFYFFKQTIENRMEETRSFHKGKRQKKNKTSAFNLLPSTYNKFLLRLLRVIVLGQLDIVFPVLLAEMEALFECLFGFIRSFIQETAKVRNHKIGP